jgi:hypothetical protein
MEQLPRTGGREPPRRLASDTLGRTTEFECHRIGKVEKSRRPAPGRAGLSNALGALNRNRSEPTEQLVQRSIDGATQVL